MAESGHEIEINLTGIVTSYDYNYYSASARQRCNLVKQVLYPYLVPTYLDVSTGLFTGYRYKLFTSTVLVRYERSRGMASRGFARRAAMLGQRYRSAQPSATYGLDRDAGTASALAGKSGREMFRGWLVFKLLTYDWIINNSLTVRTVTCVRHVYKSLIIYSLLSESTVALSI